MSDARDHNQLVLGDAIFAEPVGPAAEKKEAKRNEITKTTRPRTYDDSVLHWIARHRRVTARQLAYRYFLHNGKSHTGGSRLIASLLDHAFLGNYKLDPKKGNASQDVLYLTGAGYTRIGLKAPGDTGREIAGSDLHYLLQFTDMALQRQVEGWRLIPPAHRDEQVAAIVAWLLEPHQDHAKDIADIRVLDNIESLTTNEDFNLNIDLIVNEKTLDVRFVIPVRRGLSYGRILDEMPSMTQLDTIPIEVVCSDPKLRKDAEKYITWWGKKRRKRPVSLHRVPPYTERASLKAYPKVRSNLYLALGIERSIDLPTFGRFPS